MKTVYEEMRPGEVVANLVDEFILRQIETIVKEKVPGGDEIVVKALTNVYYNEVLENLARRKGLTIYE